jgi:rhodanese-related sulfurtransferase
MISGRVRPGGRAPFATAAVFVALAAALGLTGCSSGSGEPFARLDPAQFAARAGDSGAVLINVHVPYEGELDHTAAFIPYDHIVGDARLPADKSTEILLYCRSGRMSEIAGDALHAAGYTRLAHLEGGMRAWEAAGHPLLQNPGHASGAADHM